ncbi:MAG: maleylpyruvate isomerase N-terminal domain-containing protein, partial [Mycobacterium sp.]
AESALLAAALADLDPDRRCPTCPEWTAADLLWHLTEVHFFWAGILSRGALSEARGGTVTRSGQPGTLAALDGLLAEGMQ